MLFGPPSLPCSCMAPKLSRVWGRGRTPEGGEPAKGAELPFSVPGRSIILGLQLAFMMAVECAFASSGGGSSLKVDAFHSDCAPCKSVPWKLSKSIDEKPGESGPGDVVAQDSHSERLPWLQRGAYLYMHAASQLLFFPPPCLVSASYLSVASSRRHGIGGWGGVGDWGVGWEMRVGQMNSPGKGVEKGENGRERLDGAFKDSPLQRSRQSKHNAIKGAP